VSVNPSKSVQTVDQRESIRRPGNAQKLSHAPRSPPARAFILSQILIHESEGFRIPVERFRSCRGAVKALEVKSGEKWKVRGLLIRGNREARRYVTSSLTASDDNPLSKRISNSYHIERHISRLRALSMAAPPPPPQWVIDLNSPPITKPKSSGIPDPPGYTATSMGSKVCPPKLLQRLISAKQALETAILQSRRPRSPYPRRNRYPKAQKGMGGGTGTREAVTYDRHHDVYVWQLLTNI
jgi:hypothetical protein